jgi:DNA-binding IscR family transcriptional regulator
VEIFEGTVRLLDCICPGNSCERTARCNMRPFWKTLQKDIDRTLRSTTIYELCRGREIPRYVPALRVSANFRSTVGRMPRPR